MKLSSPWPFFYKRIFPIFFWFGISASLIVTIFGSQFSPEAKRTPLPAILVPWIGAIKRYFLVGIQ